MIAAATSDVIHGSTVATNAVLERNGAKSALVTTQGFEDVLSIGRQTRPELYNLFVPPRRPLVETKLVFGLPERLDGSGRVLQAVDRSALKALVIRLQRVAPEVVAVCLLHSYANSVHERQVAQGLPRAGFLVCASYQVLPEHREFERWSTTVLNAYVTPVVDRYLRSMERQLRSPLRIMQSNGGSISAAAARAQPVRTILSGPAAGVVGAKAVSGAAGFKKIISFDMGGTSTDVCLVDQTIPLTTDSIIGDFPVRLPVIDIHTVGAGGGSIATIDSGGALRVGPQSAGADPGPVCYGKGQNLTVTDANLLLGRLDPDFFLGGRMVLDPQRARNMAAEMARRLRLSVRKLAEGIIQVANSNMERAIRVVSVRRGNDPRDFTLVAFGGAGGMHACELAAQLGIHTILVPHHAGVLSALGMLFADVVKDFSANLLKASDEITLADLEKRFATLVAEARRSLAAEGFTPSRRVIERQLDVRYIGQSYEITLPFSGSYRHEFDRRHAKLYGYSSPSRPTEIVNLRVKASGLTDKPTLPFSPLKPFRPEPSVIRPGWLAGIKLPISFYRWDDLSPGAKALGPAVITGREATVVISPKFGFQVDPFRNILIRSLHKTPDWF